MISSTTMILIYIFLGIVASYAAAVMLVSGGLLRIKSIFNSWKRRKILMQSRLDYRDAMEINACGDYWSRYRKARAILDHRTRQSQDILAWENYKCSQSHVRKVVRICKDAQPPLWKKRKGRLLVRFFSLEAGSYGFS